MGAKGDERFRSSFEMQKEGFDFLQLEHSWVKGRDFRLPASVTDHPITIRAVGVDSRDGIISLSLNGQFSSRQSF